MLVIALTGGIGSGKSTVSDLFEEKGISVIDTDIIARKLTEKDQIAYQKVVNTFGHDILTSDKKINRSVLRELIFSSESKRTQLENILHPLIWNEVRNQLSETTAPYCIVVVPLLLEKESNINEVKFDRVLVIDTDETTQIQRVKNRDNSDDSVIKNIINSQVSRDTRISAADDVIYNLDDLPHLKEEVENLHQKYLKFSV